MTVLNDHQFELDGVVFGIGSDITVEDEGFDTGSIEWTVQDSDSTQRDGTNFGRDTIQGPTWGFVMSTDKETPEDALAVASALATTWRGERVRNTPGELLQLRYAVAGRTRCVYGRPRRWAAPPSNRLLSGYLPITADFRCVDHLFYDDVEQTFQIGITPGGVGGFVFPVIFPISTLPSGERDGQFVSSGDAYTWPIIRIDGPGTDPWVRHSDWRIDLDLSLAEGEYVEVDTRPWELTILKNGTISVAGAMRRRQRLSDMAVSPGTQEITFGASGGSNAALCSLTWRDAWNSL